MGHDGGLRATPQPPEAIGSLGGKASSLLRLGVWEANPSLRRQGDLGGEVASAGRFLQFFSIKITYFYEYFGHNSYFKAITHQLKAFEKQTKRAKRNK